jgi:transglutaminase-like putative cysteine protease
LPDGPQGIRETLKIMRDWVRAFKADPIIRDKAVNLIMYVGRNDYFGKAAAIYDFVKSNVTYVPDPNGIEMVHWPTQTLSQGAGDCDDQATLVAALMESIGIPTRFAAVGFEPGQFSHVYAEALIGRDWLPMDTTEPDRGIGWFPPGIVSTYLVRN